MPVNKHFIVVLVLLIGMECGPVSFPKGVTNGFTYGSAARREQNIKLHGNIKYRPGGVSPML